LPGIYEQRPDLRFPVLYMQDGGDLFDPATSFIQGVYWKVGRNRRRLTLKARFSRL
jgi:predicted alpha/beta superfamily hydrolase